jgi:D-threo-aldose 1-dehydrogenase
MEPSARIALGSTQVRVTRLGLGTVPIGGLYEPIGDAEAHALLQRSFELGIRLFDTAPQYGSGLAELRLSRVLPELPREELVVATKVGRLIRPTSTPAKVIRVLGETVASRDASRLIRASRHVFHRLRGYRAHPAPSTTAADAPDPRLGPVFDFSYDGAMRSLEESLARLKLDRVDLLYLHDPDYYFKQAMSGAYRALERLRADGTVGAIGVGMNQTAMLARFAREAQFDCFLVAGRYTLLDQTAFDDLLPICAEKGIGVVVGGVYNSGILADPRPGTHFNYEPATRPSLDKALRIKAVCDRYHVPLKAAAIQFPLGHPAVASVLAGSRSASEAEDNAAMLRHPIPADLWEELRHEGLIGSNIPTPAIHAASQTTSDAMGTRASAASSPPSA